MPTTPPAPSSRTDGPASSSAPTPAPKCVLVVEDDDAVREVLDQLLRTGGWEPILADSAAEGEQLFHRHRDRVGLVLTDIVMPGRNGYWLAARIRAACPNVPIVAVSGYREVAEHAVDYFLRFLPKPFRPADLLAAVRECHRDPAELARAEPAA